jgi:hypothetical protein
MFLVLIYLFHDNLLPAKCSELIQVLSGIMKLFHILYKIILVIFKYVIKLLFLLGDINNEKLIIYLRFNLLIQKFSYIDQLDIYIKNVVTY